MKNINTNYHTHIYLCKHAVGDIADYCERAIELGYLELAISDHCPLTNELITQIYTRRMSMEQYFDIYLPSIAENKVKYKDKIKLFGALEAEYFEEMHEIYPKLLKELDFLILGQHYFKYNNRFISVYSQLSIDMLKTYCDTVCHAMDLGYFKILAHPDIFCWGYPFWDDICIEVTNKIIESAIKNNVILEINVNGIRNCENTHRYTTHPSTKNNKKEEHHYAYPNYEFFKIVSESAAQVIINDDAHDPNHLHDKYTIQALEFAEDLKINVLESIKMEK